jgi:hypothetical protein
LLAAANDALQVGPDVQAISYAGTRSARGTSLTTRNVQKMQFAFQKMQFAFFGWLVFGCRLCELDGGANAVMKSEAECVTIGTRSKRFDACVRGSGERKLDGRRKEADAPRGTAQSLRYLRAAHKSPACLQFVPPVRSALPIRPDGKRPRFPERLPTVRP